MKMVKSLLLGTAAGLLAVAGAQAADMPVKAKPVLYVKICTLYGDGFYYIPGTDTCLKIAGFARYQTYYETGAFTSSATNGPFFGNGTNMRSGNQSDYIIRARSMFTLDARTQTEYGTLRSVISAGVTYDTPNTAAAATIYANRLFIQLAGFTWGQAVSFYDFTNFAATGYLALVGSSDTGDGGVKVAAYTATFGNGVSATLSFEEPRQAAANSLTSFGAISNANITGAFGQVSTGTVGGGNGGATTDNNSAATNRWPDIVGALRVDQAWGAAQIMAAVGDASSGYYAFDTNCTNSISAQAQGTSNCGHPADKAGWVVGGGILIKADSIGQGDYLQAQAQYTQGLLKYASNTPGGGASAAALSSFNVGLGIFTDGIYGKNSLTGDTQVELTTAWSVAAAYEHNWSPKWKTSWYGSYMAVSFSDVAKTLICANLAVSGAGLISKAGLVGTPDCKPNWQIWEVGSRTQWNVARGLYMGVDVMYRKLETGFNGVVFNYTSNTTRPTGLYTAKDHDALVVTYRVHRDFPY